MFKYIAEISRGLFLKKSETSKFVDIKISDNILHFPENKPYHNILWWPTG